MLTIETSRPISLIQWQLGVPQLGVPHVISVTKIMYY